MRIESLYCQGFLFALAEIFSISRVIEEALYNEVNVEYIVIDWSMTSGRLLRQRAQCKLRSEATFETEKNTLSFPFGVDCESILDREIRHAPIHEVKFPLRAGRIRGTKNFPDMGIENPLIGGQTMPFVMERYYLTDIESRLLAPIRMGVKIPDTPDSNVSLSPVMPIECSPSEIANSKVDDELSYAFWHPPAMISTSIPNGDGPVMAIPKRIMGWEFKGFYEVKIAAKVESAVELPIPAPGASERAILINGVTGLTVIKHNRSFWSRLVRFFKDFFRWTLNKLLVLWRATIGELADAFTQAKSAGREPRYPWDSDKKERVKIAERGGAIPAELVMDPNTAADLNDPVYLRQGWMLEADSQHVIVYFRDSKYTDNDGHVRLNLYFYAN